MAVTVLSQNAFAPPADPKNQYAVLLGFSGATNLGLGAGSVAVVQVGSTIYTVAPNWDGGATLSASPTDGTGTSNSQLTTSPDERLMQAYLDGTTGTLQTRWVSYPNRVTFPVGSLAICLYRTDAVGRIQEIDDYRDPAVFPGAISAKGIRTI